jgi:hypothetical protein
MFNKHPIDEIESLVEWLVLINEEKYATGKGLYNNTFPS